MYPAVLTANHPYSNPRRLILHNLQGLYKIIEITSLEDLQQQQQLKLITHSARGETNIINMLTFDIPSKKKLGRKPFISTEFNRVSFYWIVVLKERFKNYFNQKILWIPVSCCTGYSVNERWIFTHKKWQMLSLPCQLCSGIYCITVNTSYLLMIRELVA